MRKGFSKGCSKGCSVVRSVVVVVLSLSLAFPLGAQTPRDLRPELDKSYLELFESASSLKATRTEARMAEKQLGAVFEASKTTFKKEIEAREKEAERLRDSLKALNDDLAVSDSDRDSQRTDLHCKVAVAIKAGLEARKALRDAEVLFENQKAKLDLLVEWPDDWARIEDKLNSGEFRRRKHGDVADIGLRKGFEGQEEDVAWGREVLAEIRQLGILPPELVELAESQARSAEAALEKASQAWKRAESSSDPKAVYSAWRAVSAASTAVGQAKVKLRIAVDITDYVKEVGLRIARASDLRVPLDIRVLWSPEINAFALPGGIVFVNSGVLLVAKTEDELAGLLAHEIAHVTARHSRKMRDRVGFISLLRNAGLMAVLIFFPPASYGAYILFQYGLLGIDILLSLVLLGKNRASEAEADLLGAQYLWNAGYDPRGFVNLFDRMASIKGRVQGTSFFKTHPPSYNRMYATAEELRYLPERARVTPVGFDRAERLMFLLDAVLRGETAEVQPTAPSLLDRVVCEGEAVALPQ